MKIQSVRAAHGNHAVTGAVGRPRNSTLDVVLLDGDLRQSLVTIRSLGRAGIKVGVYDSVASAPALRSRWARERGLLPSSETAPDAFVDGVIAELERTGARTVITSHDGSIEALRARRPEVERLARLALAAEGPLEVAVAKRQTLALAAELGIPVPPGVEVNEVGDVDAAIDEVGLPAVVKPIRSWVEQSVGGTRFGCEVVTSRAEARASVGRLTVAGSAAILQRWLSGERAAISLLYAEGRVWARFAQVAHRMHPPLGGCSVLRESILMPADIGRQAECLVREIGLEGYSEVEFRRDADGRAYLMEINPRLSASVEVAVRAGVEFPRLLYAWASGRPLSEQTTYSAGVRMRWLGGDIRWLRDTFVSQGRPDVVSRRRAIWAVFRDTVRPAHYDYLDIHDLRPVVAAAKGFLVRAFFHGRKTETVDVPGRAGGFR